MTEMPNCGAALAARELTLGSEEAAWAPSRVRGEVAVAEAGVLRLVRAPALPGVRSQPPVLPSFVTRLPRWCMGWGKKLCRDLMPTTNGDSADGICGSLILPTCETPSTTRL